jgi:RNA polymerase sigma factor (sigma-70 family)
VCSREREASDWPLGGLDDDALYAIVAAGVRTPQADTAPVAGRAPATDRQRALELLFERYHRRAFHWCLRVLGDDELAADAVNDIFLDLLQRTRPYQPRQRFGAWLYVTARNRCLNVLRRRHREDLGDDPLERALALVAADDDPHRDAERAELDRHLQEACRRLLSPREQEVVHLRYVVGLRVDEITSLLGLGNASGARTHLRAAEQKLRRALGGRFAAPGDPGSGTGSSPRV